MKEWIDSGKQFQLIDVREQHEFDHCNIKGELIPLGTVMEAHDKFRRDVPVIVYCRSGARSARAIEALQAQFGFENLINLKGGILRYSDDVDPSIPKY
ncbi:MAG: rhodanese-like domain-containing protein [Leptospirales bacterium]|nr:rhodanese-like domain-containing protein [Leptospirales bacterium]